MKPFILIAFVLLLTGCRSDMEPGKGEVHAKYKQTEFGKLLELAKLFGHERGLEVVRETPPRVDSVDLEKLHELSGLPYRQNHTLEGATLIDGGGLTGRILVRSKKDKMVLWHEYGHWFFCANRSEEEECEIADDFADYVMDHRK